MKKFMAGLVLALATSVAFALPSEADVKAAVDAKRFDEAQTMMAEVVAARPQSAKAHYLYAEILAHNGRFADASTQMGEARRIDPALSFSDPDKVRAFSATLDRETTARSARTATPSDVRTDAASRAVSPVERDAPRGIPGWVWLVALLVIGVLLWRGFARSRAASVAQNGPGMPMQAGPMPTQPVGPGYGAPGYGAPGYGQNVGQPGAGSGALRTGMAVAGGVAGGMLLGELLHRGHDGGGATQGLHDAGSSVPRDSALGGLVPGALGSDDAAARDLESRPIDFGNGDDWGGGTDLADSGGDVGGGDDWS